MFVLEKSMLLGQTKIETLDNKQKTKIMLHWDQKCISTRYLILQERCLLQITDFSNSIFFQIDNIVLTENK